MRWYDKNGKLSKHLDSLKEMPGVKRDKIIIEIMVLIKENNPTLLDDFVGEFPLSLNRRRWYDKDPYLWLLFNGLKYANEDLIQKVISFFDEYEKKK